MELQGASVQVVLEVSASVLCVVFFFVEGQALTYEADAANISDAGAGPLI